MLTQKVKILYEDSDIIVCVKPQGMPSQRDKTRDMDMVNYLKNYLYEKNHMSPSYIVWIALLEGLWYLLEIKRQLLT